MREVRVLIIEDNPRNTSPLAIDPVENTTYEMVDGRGRRTQAKARIVAVFRSLEEARIGLPSIKRSEVDILGCDFYFRTPENLDWASDPKASAGEEAPAGGFIADRGGNHCIPSFILTSQNHRQNPLVWIAGKFRVAYRGQPKRFPAWTILLEDGGFHIPGYHYVRPLNKICRTELLPPRRESATLKRVGLFHLRNCMRQRRTIVRLAQRLHLEHLLESQRLFAAYDPDAPEEDGFLGIYPESRLRRIKDWSAAIQERLLTPVPIYPAENIVCPVELIED